MLARDSGKILGECTYGECITAMARYGRTRRGPGCPVPIPLSLLPFGEGPEYVPQSVLCVDRLCAPLLTVPQVPVVLPVLAVHGAGHLLEGAA